MTDTHRHTVNECQYQIPCPVLFLCVPHNHVVDQTCCSSHKHAQCFEPLCRPLPDPYKILSLGIPHQGMHPRENYLLSIRILITAVKTAAHSSRTAVPNTIINNTSCLRELWSPQRGFNMCSVCYIMIYSPVVTICTAQWSLYVPHSGHYMYCQFNIQQLYVLPTQCIYVFCVDLRTNSDYFPVQH
jgi:hypothetical protein